MDEDAMAWKVFVKVISLFLLQKQEWKVQYLDT